MKAFVLIVLVATSVVSASGCGGGIYVEGPVTISLTDSSVKDCQWSFRSRPDHVLMFIMQNAEELIQSFQIHDGFSNTLKSYFPYEAVRSVQNSSIFHVYTSGSLAFIRYTARSSSDHVVKFTVQPAVNCPVNIGIQTSCARVMNDGGCHCVTWTKRTWTASRAFCETRGMQLVSFESREEEIAIEKTWTNADLSVSYWTSGSDEGHEGLWVWTSTGKQLSYTNWLAGEPNNVENVEHYLGKNWKSFSKWNDHLGTYTMFAICEATP